MTVSSTDNSWSYTGDASTTVFAYSGRIFESGDLKVYLDGALQSSGYTVGGVNNEAGGTVTFATAPGSAVVVLIVRDVAYRQPQDYPEGNDFPAATVEAGHDRAVILAQQLLYLVERTVRLPAGEVLEFAALPAKADRSGKFLSFGADGQLSLTEAELTGVAATAFGVQLGQSADAAAARALLELVIGTNVQAWSAKLDTLAALASIANLSALAGLTGAADKLPHFDGAGSMTLADFTAFGRSVAAAANAAAGRSALATAWEPVAIQTAPNATTWTITGLNAAGTRYARIWLEGVVPDVADYLLLEIIGASSGVLSSSYVWRMDISPTSGSSSPTALNAASGGTTNQIRLTNSNCTTGGNTCGINGWIEIANPGSSRRKQVRWDLGQEISGGSNQEYCRGRGGHTTNAEAVTGIRLSWNGGNKHAGGATAKVDLQRS